MKFAAFVVLALALSVPGYGQASTSGVGRPASGTPLLAGEVLEYKVSYSFFTIGKIRLLITDSERRGNRTVYRAKTYIDSNPSLSWLADVHIRFYSEIDQEAFSYHWVADDSSRTVIETRTMDFDYTTKKMVYEKSRRAPAGKPEVYGRELVEIHDRSQEGLSLFYYARERLFNTGTERVPTFVDNREAVTQINFTGRTESVEIDAVDYPIRTTYVDGRADFVGVFGLTGGFEGWFSNDEARIPILARMKVILGSVKIQLVNWTRPGWSPPQAAR